jgi:hypothetical protein
MIKLRYINSIKRSYSRLKITSFLDFVFKFYTIWFLLVLAAYATGVSGFFVNKVYASSILAFICGSEPNFLSAF